MALKMKIIYGTAKNEPILERRKAGLLDELKNMSKSESFGPFGWNKEQIKVIKS